MIKRAILPVAGLGTRFLPLTKILAKELLPLVDAPLVRYAVKEVKDAGINQIIFVVSDNKANIPDYFKKNQRLENILKRCNKKELLEILKKEEEEFKGMSFSSVLQEVPRGDGDAVLKAKKQIKKEPFAVLFADDVFESEVPPIGQLEKVFSTSKKLVVGLKRVPRERLSYYGVVGVERIANRMYKIKEIKEKPNINEAPSDLVFAGRCICPPEFIHYIENTPPNKKGEVILADAFKKMIEDGKIVYGYEIVGEWLECGNMAAWLKSNLYLTLRHPKYGKELREWVKKMN